MDARLATGCDSPLMDEHIAIEELAAKSIAVAVAMGEQFDPAALRNHANYLVGVAEEPGASHAFARHLQASLTALACAIEQGQGR